MFEGFYFSLLWFAHSCLLPGETFVKLSPINPSHKTLIYLRTCLEFKSLFCPRLHRLQRITQAGECRPFPLSARPQVSVVKCMSQGISSSQLWSVGPMWNRPWLAHRSRPINTGATTDPPYQMALYSWYYTHSFLRSDTHYITVLRLEQHTHRLNRRTALKWPEI